MQIRGEAMQLAYERTDCGTAIVRSRPATNLKIACQKAIEYCIKEKGIQNAECKIGAYIHPSHKMITGHTEALNYLKENCRKFGLIKVKKHRLPGAPHSNLMLSAVEPFTQALKSMDIKDPIVPVHSNVDGQQYRFAKHVLQKLPKQVTTSFQLYDFNYYLPRFFNFS